MRKIVIVLIAFCCFLFFVSCAKDDNKLVVTNLEYTECNEHPKAMKTKISFLENTIEVSHENIPANCNFEGVLVSPVIDDETKIIEIDVDPIVVQASLDCECVINVSYTFENFNKPASDYTFIIRDNNEEIYRGGVNY